MRIRNSNIAQALAGLLTAAWFFSLSLRQPQASDFAGLPLAQSSQRLDSMTILSTKLPSSQPPVLKPVAPAIIEHGDRSLKSIALTFDACSTRQPSDYDEEITAILTRTGTPATLFLGGKWMLEHPAHTKELATNQLFELGNHTFLHPHLSKITDYEILEELGSTQRVMDSLTGRRANLFRAPYGEVDARIVRLAASVGLATVQYDLASGDPDPTFSRGRLVRYVCSSARNGSIIVMHINRHGWHTAEALPEIISGLRARGFALRTVSNMLQMSTAQGKERAPVNRCLLH